MNDTSMIVRNSIDFVLLLVYIMRNKYLRSLYMKTKHISGRQNTKRASIVRTLADSPKNNIVNMGEIEAP